MENIEKYLESLDIAGLKAIVEKANAIFATKCTKHYHEIEISSHAYKGTGKCWIQRIEDKKRTSFVDPYNVIKTDKYRTKKTFRLVPGEYLVNETGSKSQDRREILVVHPDFTTETRRP